MEKKTLTVLDSTTLTYIIQWILDFVRKGLITLRDALTLMVSINDDFEGEPKHEDK